MITPNLKKLAIRGATWTLLGYGISQLLRLVSNIILTRLLNPHLFGLVSLVSTFLVALATFSDIGLAPNVIQNPRGEKSEFLNTAWTIQAIRGIILWLGSILIAWPAAIFYERQELLYLIPILGLTMITAGFSSTAILTLNRRLELAKLNIYELTIFSVNIITMIIWALLNPSVWALVGGTLLSSVVKMVSSFKLIPNYSNRFFWDKSAADEIFSFGKWIFISTAFTFVATQADKLILGKVVSLEILGVYTIAFTFALMPQSIISKISTKVILPVLSKMTDLSRQQLRRKLLKQRRIVLLGGIVLVTLIVCFGDQLILHLYDNRYVQASWMLPILGLGIWPNLLFESSGQSLIALGKPSYQAWGQIAKSIHVTVGLILGYYWFGILGFVVIVALNDIELYAVVSYGLFKEGLSCLDQDLLATLLLLFVIFSVLMARYYLGFGWPLALLKPSH
ncbi:MAG: oligosaccharide flippase family protein [Chlorogloea purpurea SAG 13.99]|nr:oligosaccharide flippase family protein [Chlorogloea purpurea SAG 13.99]